MGGSGADWFECKVVGSSALGIAGGYCLHTSRLWPVRQRRFGAAFGAVLLGLAAYRASL